MSPVTTLQVGDVVSSALFGHLLVQVEPGGEPQPDSPIWANSCGGNLNFPGVKADQFVELQYPTPVCPSPDCLPNITPFSAAPADRKTFQESPWQIVGIVDPATAKFLPNYEFPYLESGVESPCFLAKKLNANGSYDPYGMEIRFAVRLEGVSSDEMPCPSVSMHELKILDIAPKQYGIKIHLVAPSAEASVPVAVVRRECLKDAGSSIEVKITGSNVPEGPVKLGIPIQLPVGGSATPVG